MVFEILVNIGLGNGLLPDGIKPLPEPMLTSHYQDSLQGTCNVYISTQDVDFKLCLKTTH